MTYGDHVGSGYWSSTAYGSGTTFDPGVVGGFWDDSYSFKVPRLCGTAGHRMGNESVLEDGSITGCCEVCGEQISGRRLVGGTGAERIHRILEGLLERKDDCLNELSAALDQLEAERTAIDDALRQAELAKQMILAKPADVEKAPMDLFALSQDLLAACESAQQNTDVFGRAYASALATQNILQQTYNSFASFTTC